MSKNVLMIILYILVPVIILGGAFLFLNRSQLIVVDADLPDRFPESGFSHADFESLLKKHVDVSGNIDYERWHAGEPDREQLDQYLAAVSAFSPETTPERFPRRSDALAYWIYAYNAYVIHSVLEHWPLKSVTDVKAPIEAVKGLGFFYRQRFLFGGEAYSLYAVEHQKILATYKDPRVHFVLNCASESCPILRPVLPVGDELESLLELSAADFVNDPANVRIDHDHKQVVLSTIFKWYRNDFVNDLRRRGLPADHGVISYIVTIASSRLSDEIGAAVDYELVFRDYDWTLNDSASSER